LRTGLDSRTRGYAANSLVSVSTTSGCVGGAATTATAHTLTHSLTLPPQIKRRDTLVKKLYGVSTPTKQPDRNRNPNPNRCTTATLATGMQCLATTRTRDARP
jgi:hypothetical protein